MVIYVSYFTSFLTFCSHYISHHFVFPYLFIFIFIGWFPRDGYLIEKEQIDKIRHLPTVIVQGRYDVVCPCITAYDLKKVMKELCCVV